jgi:hypothetical protein
VQHPPRANPRPQKQHRCYVAAGVRNDDFRALLARGDSDETMASEVSAEIPQQLRFVDLDLQGSAACAGASAPAQP